MATTSGAIVHTRSLLGLTAFKVTVECHVGRGLPGTTIVGLPQGAVREARDRVKSAILNSGFDYPDGGIVVNLAPGDLVKTGSSLDLAIAIGILGASGQIVLDKFRQHEFIGELGLFGELRKIPGALTCALAAFKAKRKLVLPEANSKEATLVGEEGSQMMALAPDLLAVTQYLQNEGHLNAPSAATHNSPSFQAKARIEPVASTMDKIIGQHAAKQALFIAAAGGHHALMIGPPGTGKTLLARSFTSLLPKLSNQQSIEVAAIYSAAGIEREDYQAAPFRDPHHSASAPALVGGGSPPSPGEVALAHHGVLFLDELPHFKPASLNLLREPIETGQAVISRAQYKVNFPCQFQLIAAMNPCPAGRSCREDACRCSQAQVQKYQSRISGPMLDRIDIQVRVPALPEELLTQLGKQAIALQQGPRIDAGAITAIRQRQYQRQNCLNANLSADALKSYQQAANLNEAYLTQAIKRYQLSARSFHKLWRIALSIADLEAYQSESEIPERGQKKDASDPAVVITQSHMSQALSYRSLDWENGVT